MPVLLALINDAFTSQFISNNIDDSPHSFYLMPLFIAPQRHASAEPPQNFQEIHRIHPASAGCNSLGENALSRYGLTPFIHF